MSVAGDHHRPSSSQNVMPSDAQLQSAADRIRRLSSGIDTPNEKASDLATFSEEAIRRTYRIVELGTDFWMSLLRLDPGRKLDEGDHSASDPGWLFGRTLGAMIRSWGDIKNAQRGLLWFDSSPLLGPKSERGAVHRSNLVPVVRLMTEKTVAEISRILKTHWGNTWQDGVSDELLWLGLQAGALERERRNPQGTSDSVRQWRSGSVLAFCLESDTEGERSDLTRELLVESRTRDITLKERRETLIEAQASRDTYWRPLYSFLRRGDVVAITLADQAGTGEGWGERWADGRPFALAVVTAPARWDQGGWWGRIGSVLLLDGPSDNGVTGDVRALDRERLRTAFRFPAAPPEGSETDELLETFGLVEGGVKCTNDLGLERTRMFTEWLGADPTDGSRKFAPELIEELAEPIPEGFPGPWRLVDNRDLRATVGEFLEPHAATVGYLEHQELLQQKVGGKKDEEEAKGAWLAWYPANLNMERFALVSENLRLGVIFENPVGPGGRATTQRICPDSAPDGKLRKRQEKASAERSTGKDEERRVRAANAHRYSFDHFKRGMKAGSIERPLDSEAKRKLKKKGDDQTPEQKRAAAFMPVIRLYPKMNPSEGQLFLPNKATGLLWKRKHREDEDATPPKHLTDNINEWFEESPKGVTVSVAAFPEAEKLDLYRATDARYFTKQGLTARRGEVAIDPAGTRIRNVVLVTSTKPNHASNRLLIILTDDSVAAVDVGAITWLLVAYGEELEKDHVLDVEAHARFRQRERWSMGELPEESYLEARELAEGSWELLKHLDRVGVSGN